MVRALASEVPARNMNIQKKYGSVAIFQAKKIKTRVIYLKWLFRGFAELFPYRFAVNRAAVIGTERDKAPIRGGVMDTAPLNPAYIVVVAVHEMHGSDKERIPVEIPKRFKVLHNKGFSD